MSRGIHKHALALLIAGLFSTIAFAKGTGELDSVTRGEISERIAPVGSVCLAGDDCASAAGIVVSASGTPRSGEAIYNKYCIACHSSGLLGAPKKGDSAGWQAAQKKAGGFSNLLANSISGIRSMPPKGTCADCSEDELSASIEFMSGLKP